MRARKNSPDRRLHNHWPFLMQHVVLFSYHSIVYKIQTEIKYLQETNTAIQLHGCESRTLRSCGSILHTLHGCLSHRTLKTELMSGYCKWWLGAHSNTCSSSFSLKFSCEGDIINTFSFISFWRGRRYYLTTTSSKTQGPLMGVRVKYRQRKQERTSRPTSSPWGSEDATTGAPNEFYN